RDVRPIRTGHRLSHAAERSMVLGGAGRTAEKTGFKLRNHERFLWRVVLAGYAKAGGRRKSEARVVSRMPQDNHGTNAELPALFEDRAYKRRPDALALTLWRNGHWCEAHDPQRGMAGERNRREQDMTDDRALVLSDQRNNGLCLFS